MKRSTFLSQLVLFSLISLHFFGECDKNIKSAHVRQWNLYAQEQAAAQNRMSQNENSNLGLNSDNSGSISSNNEKEYENQIGPAYYYNQNSDNEGKYYNKKHNYAQSKYSNPFDDYYSQSSFNENQEAESKTDIGSLTSLVFGAFSSLNWITTGIVLLILAPIILPTILAPLIFFGILLYYLPVIRLDLNNISKRSLGFGFENFGHGLESTGRFLNEMGEEECVKRISCEVGRMTTGNYLADWIFSKMEGFKTGFFSQISRSARQSKSISGCKVYTCNPSTQFNRIMRSFSGNATKIGKIKSVEKKSSS